MAPGSRILVTGPTGFIGQRLCEVLADRGHAVRAAARRPLDGDPTKPFGVRLERVLVGDIQEVTDWSAALADVYGVIHLAGRAHVMRERGTDPLAVYRQINVAGTLRLAEAAVAAGVKRFVYVSTIKVNGEYNQDRPFSEKDQAQPSDPYAISKWEAEQALHKLAAQTGLEVVVVRPPLVYGPGVKGNFLSLMRLVHKGVPLPLGRCDNRRSLLGLDNLLDFLETCISHPASPGQTFLLSDGEDLSTPELIRHLGAAMDMPVRLLPVPSAWLKFVTRMLGRDAVYQRLCGSLHVDSSYAHRMLGWAPPQNVAAGLAATVQAFLQELDR